MDKLMKVKSSMFKQLGYIEDSEILFVRFNTDALYMYMNVSKKLWVDMQAADSMGSYFSKNIRNCHDYQRIE